jgi:hypothetical protein
MIRTNNTDMVHAEKSAAVNMIHATSGRPPITHLLRGMAWLLMAVAVIPTSADPDLWGNVRFGSDVLATGRVTTVDPYSFTEVFPWINHEWLPQVAMSVAYRLGGTPGLVALKTIIVGLTVWLIAGAFKGAKSLVPEAAAALVLWAALPITLTLRAQLWTFLGLAILSRMLIARSPKTRRGLPLLFAVWSNCHIGWTIGLAIVFLWTVESIRRGDTDRGDTDRGEVLIVATLSALATLATPYGWHFWTFAASVAHVSRPIQEWQPLWTSPVVNWLPWTLALIAAIMYARIPPRLTPERTLVIAGLAYAALRVAKFSGLFVEVTVLMLAPAVRRLHVAGEVNGMTTHSAGMRWLNAAVVAGASALALTSAAPHFQCLPAGNWHPDATVGKALKDADASGRIAVWFDWGEYTIWHFGPQLRVSFDPRYDLMYSAATIREQNALAAAPPGTAFLERTRPEYVWFPQSKGKLKAWVADHGYRIDVDTPESFLAVRDDLPSVRTPKAQTFGCFPAL